MGLVVAISGMPGCGKGEFSSIAKKRGIPVFSMGDLIRQEVSRLNLPENPQIFGKVAQEMRDEFGEGVLAEKLIEKVNIEANNAALVIIEGLRGIAEDAIFRKKLNHNFSILSIEASSELRFERVQKRKRSEDGDISNFLDRDAREAGWGLSDIIEAADWRIVNEGDLGSYRVKIENWIENVLV